MFYVYIGMSQVQTFYTQTGYKAIYCNFSIITGCTIHVDIILYRTRGGVVNKFTTLQTGRSRDRFPIVSLEFFSDIILPVTLWPWGRLSL